MADRDGKGRGGRFLGSFLRRSTEGAPAAPPAEQTLNGAGSGSVAPAPMESDLTGASRSDVPAPPADEPEPQPEDDPAEAPAVQTEPQQTEPQQEESETAPVEDSGPDGATVSDEQQEAPEAATAPDAPTPETHPERFELPRVVSIANQKGGVGKTTTSVSLGASLAEMGSRVLVIDLDPQGNATTGLGINARNLEASIYDVLMSDLPLEDCIEATSIKNLFVAPATIDLAGAEIELVPAFSRELKLKRAIDGVKDDFDWVIIDCPPSLGLLTINALAASNDVIVPIQCEYYALEGLSQLVRNVSLVQTNLNPGLEVRGIVLTMYDGRTKLSDQVQQEVRNHFGPTVYQTVIPRTVRLSEAPSFGTPITVFDSLSRGAVAYRELAKEVSHGTSRRAG